MTKLQLIYDLSDTQLLELYQQHGSITKSLQSLAISNDPRCRAIFSRRLAELTGSTDHSTKHRPKDDTVALIIEASKTCTSLTSVLLAAKLQPVGSNFARVRQILDDNDITFEPTTPQKWTHEAVYCSDSSFDRRSLSKRVRRDGWLPYKCTGESCVLTDTWLDKPLNLHLDHIDGNCKNNVKPNLRWLCPNCHSQTPTYGGKNNKI